MRTTLFLASLVATAALAPLASAVVVVHFGAGLPEGTSLTSFSGGGVTLHDLDRGNGTAPDAFVVEDASGALRFERGFAGTNVLGFGPHVPGPDTALARCKSFAIDLAAPVTLSQIGMWVSRADAGNVLHFELLLGAASVQTIDATIPPGSALYRMSLALGASPVAPYDRVRVTCTGPSDGGAFHGVLDAMFFGVPDSVPPPWCGEASSGNTPCPCGNGATHLDQEGCLSSRGFGARMRAAGSPSLSNDTLELRCQQLPSSSAILVQGSPFVQTGIVFGDGTICAGGALVRIAAAQVAGGEIHYPELGDAPLSTLGASAGATFGYAVVYRNAAAYCTSATFNASDTQPVTWSP